MTHRANPRIFVRKFSPIAQQVPILANGCFQTGACTVASGQSWAKCRQVNDGKNGSGTPRDIDSRGQTVHSIIPDLSSLQHEYNLLTRMYR